MLLCYVSPSFNCGPLACYLKIKTEKLKRGLLWVVLHNLCVKRDEVMLLDDHEH